MITRLLRSLAVMVLVFPGSLAATCRGEDSWEPYRFLMGNWVGEGGGEPGKGRGEFSFGLELRDKILVRRNHAELPATTDRPAVVHEDLMVVYPGESQNPAKAIYFDSEGRVIHYTATFSPDRRTLTFTSDAASSGPRFRLSYTKEENGAVRIKFETAPPGKPDGFTIYLEGRARRKDGGQRAGTQRE